MLERCPGVAPDDPDLTRLLDLADGIPAALEACTRAIATFGPRAVAVAPEKALLENDVLRTALERAWSATSPVERDCLVLLTAWTGWARSSSLAELPAFRFDAAERLITRGLLLSQPDGRDARVRLLRPLRVFVADRAHADALLQAEATHAATTARQAQASSTDFELTGNLDEVRACVDEALALGERALARPSLLPHAIEALPAFAPLVCFERADRDLLPTMRAVIQAARTRAPTSVEMGHALLALALAERARGDRGAADELLAESERMAEAAGAQGLLGRLARLRGSMLLDRGRPEDAEIELRRAVELLEAGGDDTHRALALQWLGFALGRTNKLEEGITCLSEAVAIHRASGNQRMLLYEKSMLGALYAQAGDLRRGRIAIMEAQRLAAGLGDSVAKGFAHASLAYNHLAERQPGAAIDEAKAGARCFFEAGQSSLVAYCRGVEGVACLFAGMLDAGLSLLEEALHEAKPEDAALYGAYIATIDAKDGRIDRARARIRKAQLALDGPPTATGEAIRILAAGVESLAADRGQPTVAGRSVDARIATAWLERLGLPAASARSPSPGTVFLIRADGTAFTGKDGAQIRLAGKPVMVRLLRALAAHRSEQPGEPLGLSPLVERVWPGERMLEQSARTRLHAAVLRLREMGLRTALLHTGDGYCLEPMETEIDQGTSDG
jgi:tetratricopeptide (TPR) repeat protein